MSQSVPPPILLPNNIFVPQQYAFTDPVKLFPQEKAYIQLILQIAEEFIAHNLMNLVIAGWYNVTFDNYPSLRALLPANYTDTIVGLATQVTIAIQNLDAQDEKDEALSKQFIPIGRRHYMHGAEAVTLLCSAPCLVQSMYNVLVSTIDRIVGFLGGVKSYPDFFIKALRDAGQSKPPSKQLQEALRIALADVPEKTPFVASLSAEFSVQGKSGVVELSPIRWNPAEKKLLDAASLSEVNLNTSPPVSFVKMMIPPSLTYGGFVPRQTIERILKPVPTDFERRSDARQPSQDPLDQIKELSKALGGLPVELLLVLFEDVLRQEGPDGGIQLTKLIKVLNGDFGDFGGDTQTILEELVSFVIRYLLPVLLIPFGRFVDCMVGIITAGVGTESSIRLLASWETHLKPRAEEFARNFWWTLLEVDPSLRLPLGLQTGAQLEVRMDQLTKQLADGLNKNFPYITTGGLPFKQQLMALGKIWSDAGWPTDGYDAVRIAFLATVDSMLFNTDPVYAATIPAIRLKAAYSQLVSIVNTEFIYGAGGNTFNAIGGILGGIFIPRLYGKIRLRMQFGAVTCLLIPHRAHSQPVTLHLTVQSPGNGTYAVLISDLMNGNERVFESDPETGVRPNTLYTIDYRHPADTMFLLLQINWSLLGNDELVFVIEVAGGASSSPTAEAPKVA